MSTTEVRRSKRANKRIPPSRYTEGSRHEEKERSKVPSKSKKTNASSLRRKKLQAELEAKKQLPEISSGGARKRFKYLIKQGLPAEGARVKSVEPVKEESTSDRDMTKTPDGQPKKKTEGSRKRQQCLNAYQTNLQSSYWTFCQKTIQRSSL
ncbi:hypothetical protein JTB14_010282 [Gonioctena quinquepunctata]|nr:hypothetical protein JTB14_010282 [Gonioctena quinquepunctata]